MRIRIACAVVVVIMLLGLYGWIVVVERGRTDGRGIPLARYDGVFGEPGSRTYVEVTYDDGWVFFHSINPFEAEICGRASNDPDGLRVGGRTISLSRDGITLSAYGGAYRKRSAFYKPSLDAMWNLDGKSSLLEPCKPSPWEALRLLVLALSGAT